MDLLAVLSKIIFLVVALTMGTAFVSYFVFRLRERRHREKQLQMRVQSNEMTSPAMTPEHPVPMSEQPNLIRSSVPEMPPVNQLDEEQIPASEVPAPANIEPAQQPAPARTATVVGYATTKIGHDGATNGYDFLRPNPAQSMNGHSGKHNNGKHNGKHNGHIIGHANGKMNGHVNGTVNGFMNGQNGTPVNGQNGTPVPAEHAAEPEKTEAVPEVPLTFAQSVFLKSFMNYTNEEGKTEMYPVSEVPFSSLKARFYQLPNRKESDDHNSGHLNSWK